MSLKLRRNTLIRLSVDVFIMLTAGLSLLLIHILVKPFSRGFFCDDQSIQHPYKEDTIPMPLCGAIGSIIAILSFFVVEFSVSLGCKKTHDTHLFSVLWTIAKLVSLFCFGAGATLILTETGKLSLGRLRPNFFAVCKPDMTAINCTQYVELFTCTNTAIAEKIIMDSRKSFPSGHSSFVAFSAMFVSFYYQKRLKIEFSVLLKMFLQLVMVVLAMFTMYSRVSDYKHHWGDVFGGAVLGMGVATWIILCLGCHVDLNPKFPYKKSTSYAETQQLPLSDPCTPEPTFLAGPQFDKNSV